MRPYLFKPATAIRVRPSKFTGTPMPKDEPLAANPPDGALIDYALPADAAGPVTLSILDAHDGPVRRFSSTDPTTVARPVQAQVRAEWVPPPVVLATTPGMHRFVWDLRYASAEPATEERPTPQGAWAPPGRYEIELNVGGKKFRQALEVKEDPRVTISQAALLREFTLTQQIEQASARASNAVTAGEPGCWRRSSRGWRSLRHRARAWCG